MSRCIPSINPNLPIPELIKITQHSNRECDFLEVQSILMEREKKMQIEIQNLQMGHDSAKKQALQKLAGLKKKKLRRSRRKCKALNEEITSLNFRVVKLGEEIEGLKQGKEELKRHNVEAAKALDELRERKRESDELAKLYECSFEARITKVEGSLARLLNVKVEDLAKLVAALETCGAATKPENLDFGPGDRNLVHTQKEDDDGAKSGGSPRVEPHVSDRLCPKDWRQNIGRGTRFTDPVLTEIANVRRSVDVSRRGVARVMLSGGDRPSREGRRDGMEREDRWW